VQRAGAPVAATVAPPPGDAPKSTADSSTSAGPANIAPPVPERHPGPPLVLGDGREAAAPKPQGEQPQAVRESSAASTNGVQKDGSTGRNERSGEEAVALAADVVAAVETETDDDPEWAQLARGPEAFPAGPRPADAPRRDGKDD
jgi:hypothetical protein